MRERYIPFMQIALAEAKQSLKEGNHGFGAVVVRNETVIAKAHDTEETNSDPTAHAELTAIRLAAQALGTKDLHDCFLVTTHEPCPMCTTAMIWSGMTELAYGYSIRAAMTEKRKRIDVTSQELFERAGIPLRLVPDVMFAECSLLYRDDVRKEVKRLRGAQWTDLERMKQALTEKRLCWYAANASRRSFAQDNLPLAGYELLLEKLGIDSAEAPIVEQAEKRVVFHSMNFCPTLEACKLLDLDTREICKMLTEEPTDVLVKQLNRHLKFSRNYANLRPYSEYCEEMVSLEENAGATMDVNAGILKR